MKMMSLGPKNVRGKEPPINMFDLVTPHRIQFLRIIHLASFLQVGPIVDQFEQLTFSPLLVYRARYWHTQSKYGL